MSVTAMSSKSPREICLAWSAARDAASTALCICVLASCTRAKSTASDETESLEDYLGPEILKEFEGAGALLRGQT